MKRRKIMKAGWAPGAHMKIDPNATLEELQEIERDNDGMVTNEAIVKKAKPKTSAMHRQIDWNVETAAERWRLHQAHVVKQMIRVVFEGEEERGLVYYFVSIETRDAESGQHTGGYSVSIERAMSSAPMRRRILDDALRGLQEWMNRNRELEDLSKLIKVISENWPGGMPS